MFRARLFEYLSARLSVGARLALVAACIAPAVGLPLYLYLGQAGLDVRFAQREEDGAVWLAEVWPSVISPGDSPAPRPPSDFNAGAELRRFDAARGVERSEAGAALMRRVADSSNLTLDTDLDSFYAMDAATVELPQLLVASQAAGLARAPQEQALADRELRIRATAAESALRTAMGSDPSGHARAALAGPTDGLAKAAAAGAAGAAELRPAIDRAWRADQAELARMLRARVQRLQQGIAISLTLIGAAILASAFFMIGVARNLAGRLRGLTTTIDRLNSGDVTVDMPFLSDQQEVGRIARALAELKQRRLDAIAEHLLVETANAAARDSEARYRMLAEAATDIILRYDATGVIEFISPSVAQIGFRPEDLIGRSAFEVFESRTGVTLQQRLDLIRQDALPPGAGQSLVEVRRPDGEPVLLEGKPSRLTDEEGRFIGAVTVLRDVTARLALEAELERRRVELEESSLLVSEAHRQAVMAEELAGVGHWRRDLKTGQVYWSDGVFQIFGFDPKAGPPPIGSAYALYDAEDRPMIGEALRRTETLGEPYAYETRVTRADGSVRSVRARGAAECNAAGEIVAVFGVIIDITEARMREEALRDSEARYRMLAERATDIIVRYDRQGVMEYISPSVRQLGYRAEDLVGRSIADFTDPDTREAALAAIAELAHGRLPRDGVSGEFRVERADGSWVWLEGSPALLRDDDGTMIGVVTALRDVTARREAEAELRRKRAEAEAAAQAKAEFLANMSHEIRTPLTGVIGFAGLMGKMQDLPERARTFTRRILTGGQALLSLVNDILDFSRLEAGQVELAPQPTALRPLFEDSIELVRPEAEAKGLNLDLRLADDLPDEAFVDGERVRQVLLNLVGNAIKFTAAGQVTVEAGPAEGERGRLRITVRDTGVGISAEHGDRLFQRFSQVDGSNTRRYGGAGLGLAISKGLVELMGGEIGVESAEGRGSTFWFTLAAPAGNAAPSVGQADGETALTPLRILVVDDVAVNRELVTALLSPFELQLTEAANGAEAVEAAGRDPFDLILMDLQMPVMDGLAATRAIREGSSPNAATPILAVSANVMPPQVEACMAAGMNDHIAKPIDPQSLLNKIVQWTASAA